MIKLHQAMREFYGRDYLIVHTTTRGRKSYIEFTNEPGTSRESGARKRFMGAIDEFFERVQREIGPKKRVAYAFEEQKGIGKSQGFSAAERAANENDKSQVSTIRIRANKHAHLALINAILNYELAGDKR